MWGKLRGREEMPQKLRFSWKGLKNPGCTHHETGELLDWLTSKVIVLCRILERAGGTRWPFRFVLLKLWQFVLGRIADLFINVLHDKQLYVVRGLEKKQVVVVSCGRIWGKSVLSLVVAIVWALRGHKVVCVLPTHMHRKMVWARARRMLERAMENGELSVLRRLVKLYDSEATVRVVNGGEVVFVTIQGIQTILGMQPNLLVIDEAACIEDALWNGTLRPLLLKPGQNKKTLLIGSPRGKNWFYGEYIKALASPGRAAALQFPSWTSPLVSNDQVKRMRLIMPDKVFRQEVGAEFVG